MKLVCLDLEGVLVPEIWINVAERSGIKELRLTTRDIADYDELMSYRLKILAEKKISLADITDVIGSMEPLEGAKDFLADLRSQTQVIILSDTFSQFAAPLMAKLDWPTLFCNELIIDDDGMISDYHLRQYDGKTKAVKAFQSMGMVVFAAGDSFNDTGMLLQADAASFFLAPETIRKQFPQLPGAETYSELMNSIAAFLN